MRRRVRRFTGQRRAGRRVPARRACRPRRTNERRRRTRGDKRRTPGRVLRSTDTGSTSTKDTGFASFEDSRTPGGQRTPADKKARGQQEDTPQGLQAWHEDSKGHKEDSRRTRVQGHGQKLASVVFPERIRTVNSLGNKYFTSSYSHPPRYVTFGLVILCVIACCLLSWAVVFCGFGCCRWFCVDSLRPKSCQVDKTDPPISCGASAEKCRASTGIPTVVWTGTPLEWGAPHA